MQVQRYDRAELKAVITDEGFLQDSPVVGRIGIQEYRREDGSIRRELRLPEEVFHPDALASLKGKPITVDHPSTGKVDKKNAHRLTVGTMLSEGRQDGDYVRVDLVLHSPDAIGDRKELSLGYTAHLDETPGEHPVFGKYDANGKLIPCPLELVRLAIPRRVYTQSHIDYVAEVIIDVFQQRDQIKGLRITEEAEVLRHFTAKLVPVDNNRI